VLLACAQPKPLPSTGPDVYQMLECRPDFRYGASPGDVFTANSELRCERRLVPVPAEPTPAPGIEPDPNAAGSSLEPPAASGEASP
jgi:hypothetical protein